mmetsp:Transcript_112305/g.322853  ORF Transcript_112305/g.322853 Transcript_112305/m.322853 type:complete len:405 (+) Transcript_112305:103-1317(+)
MPTVGVLFEVDSADTLPGEVVSVVGSLSELGRWKFDLEQGVYLSTNAFMYPQWTGLHPVWLHYEEQDCTEGALTFQYKHVLLHSGGRTVKKWEDGIPNRTVSVSLVPSSLWLITGVTFNKPATPRVTRTSMAQVRERWASFVPEWMALPKTTPRAIGLSPDKFMLTPRVPEIGHFASPRRYSIEAEFSVMSPKVMQRLKFESPHRQRRPRLRSVSAASSKSSSASSTSACSSDSEGEACGKLRDNDGDSSGSSPPERDYRRECERALEAVDALRQENRRLRESLEVLTARKCHQASPLASRGTPRQHASPGGPRLIPRQPAALVCEPPKPLELASAEVLLKRCGARNSKAKCLTKDVQGDMRPTDVASPTSLGAGGSPMRSARRQLRTLSLVPEPQEEPQLEDL